MSVLRVVTVVTRVLHVQIQRVRFSVLVVLVTQEMEHTVKVSG